jgi:hypothetical protein
MNKAKLFILFFIVWTTSYSQWSGNYEGALHGDKIILKLTQEGKDKVSGEMSDSYQSFKITGDLIENRLTGNAVEQSSGLKFALLGEIKGSTIEFKLVANILGLKSETPFTVSKISVNQTSKTTETKSNSSSSSIAKGGSRDPKLVGRWTKNESYNSGYGDNFMGANFSQSILFLENGTVADGGSNANMSGSNYSGNSSVSGNTEAIPGLTWFTRENQLYLSYTTNGQTQTESLGRYYIENGKMLLTMANGSKILLTR